MIYGELNWYRRAGKMNPVLKAQAGSALNFLVRRPRSMRSSVLVITALAILFASAAEGQTSTGPRQTASAPTQTDAQTETLPNGTATGNSAPKPAPQPPPQRQTQSQREKAAEELKQQEHQRVLVVIPAFNSTDLQNAVPLTPDQKFHLAFRTAVDPYQFAFAALDAGISQAENNFAGYGQGAQGYAKRFGAAYTDQFSGTLLGSAVFPVLLHEDPRYFRRGTGSIKSRLLYAISTAVWQKRDNGSWGPNYANVLGSLAAGGLANLYYPSNDRGVGLTFQRAFTVTAESTIGATLIEFWPDISRYFRQHRNPPPATGAAPNSK